VRSDVEDDVPWANEALAERELVRLVALVEDAPLDVVPQIEPHLHAVSDDHHVCQVAGDGWMEALDDDREPAWDWEDPRCRPQNRGCQA
jgi:hypothetical protein